MGSSIGTRAGSLLASLLEGEERVSAEQACEAERTVHTRLETTFSSFQVPRKLMLNVHNSCTDFCMNLSSLLWDKCPKVQLLGGMVSTCLIL